MRRYVVGKERASWSCRFDVDFASRARSRRGFREAEGYLWNLDRLRDRTEIKFFGSAFA